MTARTGNTWQFDRGSEFFKLNIREMATNEIGKHFSSNESSDNFQQKRKTENKIERKNEFANNQFD
jgi:hypothetical protein